MPSSSFTAPRMLVGAAVVTTCVLFAQQAADPVNPVKLVFLLLCAIGVVACAGYAVVRHRTVSVVPVASAVACLLAVAFVVSAAVAPVGTTAVLGAYGRNSGLLAYLSAVVLLLACVHLLTPPHTRVLVGAIVTAGLFTASYGLLQRVGVDAVPWNNPFNPVIAALGNPNFASGYLGIAASVAAGGALWAGWARPWRIVSGVTAGLCLLAALVSASVQGPIAAGAGLFVVAVAWAMGLAGPRRRGTLLGLGALAGLGGLALVAAAVTKAGPLGAIFTDAGSRARALYWRTALEMFGGHPVLGVGLDQYGGFWRVSRPVDAVESLGGPHFTDAAHSVPLQMLAQGGLLLAVAYAAMIGLVLYCLVVGLRRLTGSDRMLLGAVGGGWTAYQVQSLVSIDQVPLIVLHFTLAGALIAVSGVLPARHLRLPGALKPVATPKGDARTRRRLVTTTARAREATPTDAVLLGLLGLVLVYASWQALVPLRASLAVGDGDRQLAAGDGNGALAAYDRATDLVPGSAVYWMRKGELLRQVQQPARARAAFNEAATRDSYDINALLQAASFAETAGDLDAAREYFNRALEVDPLSPKTITAAATFELRHSGAAVAREVLEKAVTTLPLEASLWATLGDARAVLGDAGGARSAYARALDLEPSQETAQQGLRKLQAG